jgi:hypothetical protein
MHSVDGLPYRSFHYRRVSTMRPTSFHLGFQYQGEMQQLYSAGLLGCRLQHLGGYYYYTPTDTRIEGPQSHPEKKTGRYFHVRSGLLVRPCPSNLHPNQLLIDTVPASQAWSV